MCTGYSEDSIPFAQETAGYNEESGVQRGGDQQWYLSLLPWDLARHPVIRDCTARPDAKLALNNFTLSLSLWSYILAGACGPLL